MKLTCINNTFTRNVISGHPWTFKIGNQYEYWTNFGGLNHFVKDSNGKIFSFTGPLDDGLDGLYDGREYIFDYFIGVQEYRHKQLDLVLNDFELKCHTHRDA